MEEVAVVADVLAVKLRQCKRRFSHFLKVGVNPVKLFWS
jgi:hypothetical protein